MIKHFTNIFVFIFPFLLFSQIPTGPGGVGNSGNNGLWLKADDINLSDGTQVAVWDDRSGNNNHATNSLTAEQPDFRLSSSINGRPSLHFDGILDQMIIDDADILDGTVGITFYTVIRPDNLDTRPRGILGKRTNQDIASNYAYTFFFFNSNRLFLDVDLMNNRFSTSPITFSSNNNYMLGFDFDGARASGVRSRILSAGNVIKVSADSATILPASNEPLVLGGLNEDYNNGGQKRLGGDYAEVIHYNRSLNTAERKIVENYLGAKYAITIANDLYTHQGAYAGEVAGIGRDDATNLNNDAKGSAMVRINSPSSLDDGDFMIWGHNESSIDAFDTIDVDKIEIETRMSRVWSITKTNDVGTVDVIFDHSEFSPISPTDLRLLIDRDGDGFADNDVTPLLGSVTGSLITFTGVSFANNDKFTLGSIDFDQTPLPVELIDFHLESNDRDVDIIWTTASELNADYYLLSKSKSGKSFNNFANVQAAGTTSSVSNYRSIDSTPYSGISYYKLIQVDFDGVKTHYGPLSVNRQQEQSFVLVPNPTKGAFKLKSAISTKGNTSVLVYNSTGILVKEVVLTPEEVNAKFIELGLVSGVYFVKVIHENGTSSSLKLVVN